MGQGGVVPLVHVVVGHIARELGQIPERADLGHPVGILGRGVRAGHHLEELRNPVRQLAVLIVEDFLEPRIQQIREVRGARWNRHVRPLPLGVVPEKMVVQQHIVVAALPGIGLA